MYGQRKNAKNYFMSPDGRNKDEKERWSDSVGEDFRTMRVRNRSQKAKDRNNWSRIVRPVKIHIGL